MSAGYGLKDPMPLLSSRNSLTLSCYRELIHKYGKLTPIVIKNRYKQLVRSVNVLYNRKRGRPEHKVELVPGGEGTHQEETLKL